MNPTAPQQTRANGPAAPPPVIEIEDLGVTLDRNEILREVTLTIRAGEYLSIVGPNGAGKSTLIRCLAGLCPHWSGRIRIGGRDLPDFSGKQRARIMSYVPQAQERAMPFTVHEFVMMGRYPHLSPFTSCRPEDEHAVQNALEVTGVTHFRHRIVDTLSGGERQNVYIAAALAQQAHILILDEPATFLDYRHQREVMNTIRDVNRTTGKTVITVNHDINSAVAASHRILALKDGRVAFLGASAEIMQTDILNTIFDTRFRFIPDPVRQQPLVVAE